MNLGTTIKKLRKQRGLKQFEFAERANITAAYLSLVETGQREPSLDFLKKISEVLSLPIPVILFLSLDESDVPPNKRQAFEIVRKPVLAMIDGFFFSDYVHPERKKRTLTRQDLPKKNGKKWDASLHIEAFRKSDGERVFICDVHYGDDNLCFLENAEGVATKISELEIYEP